MPNRLVAMLALSVSLLVSCSGSRADRPDAVEPRALLQYADERGANHPALEAAEEFARLLERSSGGALLARVNGGGRFGSEESVVEQLRFGGIDLARVGLRSLAVVSPTARRLGAPGALPADRSVRSALEGEDGRLLDEELESSRLVALAWYDGGPDCRLLPRGRGSRDFEGLRVGVDSSRMALSFIVEEGGMPIPLALHDFRRALDTGLVDAFFVPLLSAWSERLLGSMDALPMPESRSAEALVASRATFMRLLPIDREYVREAAAASESFQGEYYDDALGRAEAAAEAAR